MANGIDKPNIRKTNIIKEKYNLDENNYILFLSRIVPGKGLEYLIDAYKNINTQKKLVIAGGASHTDSYLEKIKQEVEENNNIIMTGFVQGEELEELYSNCYLYCLPSDSEGMPMTLLEAMSYGKNVLVSDIAEITQVANIYATTFKKGQVEDLKLKLEECLEGKNRFDSKEISDFVLKRFNWGNIIEQITHVYNEGKEKEG